MAFWNIRVIFSMITLLKVQDVEPVNKYHMCIDEIEDKNNLGVFDKK